MSQMHDGYRIVKRIAIVLVTLAILNFGLRALGGASLVSASVRLILAVVLSLAMLRGSNIARWWVVVSSCLGAVVGLIGYSGVGGEIGYFHWVSLWVLCFVFVDLGIAGFLVFSRDVNEFFGT